jgi:hypothetical protein
MSSLSQAALLMRALPTGRVLSMTHLTQYCIATVQHAGLRWGGGRNQWKIAMRPSEFSQSIPRPSLDVLIPMRRLVIILKLFLTFFLSFFFLVLLDLSFFSLSILLNYFLCKLSEQVFLISRSCFFIYFPIVYSPL